MNELDFYDNTTEAAIRGWTNIMVADGTVHSYIAAWWPDAHIIGYEHGFINQAADIVNLVTGKCKPQIPLVDFNDALKTQLVMEAAIQSARGKCPVKIAEL